MSSHPFAPRPRAGFTLIELLISMVMISVLGLSIVSVVNSQQRFARAAAVIGGQRQQMQTALAVLPADLRGLSATGGDIIAMSDSSIHVRSTIGVSIVCAFAGTAAVTLAPEGFIPGTSVRLTSLAMAPMAGDSLYICDDGADASAGNDVWAAPDGKPYGVTGVVATPGACPVPYTTAANATADAYVLTMGTQLRPSIERGSALRVVRNIRYGLYQSAVDNAWYLGYRDPDPAITRYQYVAGPFRTYDASPSGASGVRLRYFDATNTEITNYALTTTVARIEITARTESSTPVSLGGATRGKTHLDSLRVGIALRNR